MLNYKTIKPFFFFLLKIIKLFVSFFIIFLGSSVTLDDNDCIYLFGGYDLLSGQVQFCNDFFQLEDLTSKKYKINIIHFISFHR